MKSYFARAWATTFSGVLEGWKNNRRKDRSGIRKGFILLGVARIIASFIVAPSFACSRRYLCLGPWGVAWCRAWQRTETQLLFDGRLDRVPTRESVFQWQKPFRSFSSIHRSRLRG